MRYVLPILILALWLGRPAHAEPMPVDQLDGDIVMNIGDRRSKKWLGRGWGRSERHGQMKMRWIRKLEADVRFKVKAVDAMDLWVVAAPIEIDGLRQNIGIFINNKYVTEWVCPASPAMATYHTLVPASFIKEGKNILTFRMGHLRVPPGDERELSITVDRIMLRAKRENQHPTTRNAWQASKVQPSTPTP